LRQFRSAKKISKTVLKSKLKTKETTNTLIAGKYLVGFLRSHSIRAFSVIFVFGDYLKNLTCWKKSKHQIWAQRTKIMKESLIFFFRQDLSLKKISCIAGEILKGFEFIPIQFIYV
jgi:hypothetical protein